MKEGKDGYIDFWEYRDIFELIKAQEVPMVPEDYP
jgi:hypothetical protein